MLCSSIYLVMRVNKNCCCFTFYVNLIKDAWLLTMLAMKEGEYQASVRGSRCEAAQTV